MAGLRKPETPVALRAGNSPLDREVASAPGSATPLPRARPRDYPRLPPAPPPAEPPSRRQGCGASTYRRTRPVGCLLASSSPLPPGLITSRPREGAGEPPPVAPAWAAEGIRAAAFSSRAWAPGLPKPEPSGRALLPRGRGLSSGPAGPPRLHAGSPGRAHPLPLSAFRALVSRSGQSPNPRRPRLHT